MQGLKRLVRKIAAVGAGGVMLGATITGAMAAGTLDMYPEPFVSGGKFIKVAAVIGDEGVADGADSLALTSVIAKLQQKATSGSSSGGTVSVSGGTSADIPLGKPIASTTGNEFETSLEDDDIDSLFDGTINYRSSDYDVSEVFMVSANETTSLVPQTSLTSNDDDYNSNIMIESERGAMRYYYSFDETINISAADSTDSLDIDFLGKKLKITNVDSTGTKFTANVGIEYFMNVGDAVTVEGKSITLSNVGSGGAIIVDVDGTTETISASGTRTVNGIEIKNDQTFYDANSVDQRSATLVMGLEATDTYQDGDAYVGEDDNDPDWVWTIAGLYTGGTTSLINNATNGITASGMVLGVKNEFVKNDASDDPIAMGECYDLPNNFLSVCFDSLTVPDNEYMSLIIEYDASTDLSESRYQGTGLTSEPTIYIHVDQSEGLVLDQANLPVPNGTAADRKTDKLWIYANGTAGAEEVPVFYEDTNSKTILAGYYNASVPVELAHLNYQDITGNDIRIFVSGNQTHGINVTVAPYDATDLSDWTDNITSYWGVTGNKVKGLGGSSDSAEASELYWMSSGGSLAKTIGTKDEDHKTKYGIIIKNPDSNGAQDDLKLMIPGDLVKANVVISGTRTNSDSSTPSTTSVAPTPITASELTNPTSFNIISVGGPCVNSVTADLLGVTYPACGSAQSAVPENKAIIEMKANGNNWAMIVAGWNAMDTRRAGVVLANYESFSLTGTSATVTGTDLTVSGITVA